MKIYVAGSSSERQAVRGALGELRAAGMTVTYDWTESAGWDRPCTPEEHAGQASADLQAVADADVLWLRLSDQKSEGAHAELGYALGLGKYVVVSGPISGPSRIFPLLADLHFDDHEGALTALKRATGPEALAALSPRRAAPPPEEPAPELWPARAEQLEAELAAARAELAAVRATEDEVAEIREMFDAQDFSSARERIDRLALRLGNEHRDVVGAQTMLHFLDDPDRSGS